MCGTGGPIMSTRRTRGRAKKTLDLIDAIVEIARGIQPCRVRSLAYQLFIRKLIPSMAIESTKKVSQLCTIAREEGTMPWEWITDESRAVQSLATWADPEDYADTVMHGYLLDKWRHQPTFIIVVSEKGTMDSTIWPVLKEYEVPFQVLHGWSGATAVWEMAQANLRRKQKTLILYVGDRDPSGMYMSEVDLPKRLARYSSDTPADKDVSPEWVRRTLAGIRLEVRRIALTETDTVALGPAVAFPASDKKKDSRYPWFVANYGDRCWELDALSPPVLRRRLEEAITAELDRELWDRYVRVEEIQRAQIIETCRTWPGYSGQVPK
jgi:hypothetical protein